MADFERLQALLDQGHAALMAGDLSVLAGLATEVEVALGAAGSCDLGQARQLAALASRNERLLEAALGGVRAARRRARDLSDQGRFSTYDVGGQRGQPGLTGAATARRI